MYIVLVVKTWLIRGPKYESHVYQFHSVTLQACEALHQSFTLVNMALRALGIHRTALRQELIGAKSRTTNLGRVVSAVHVESWIIKVLTRIGIFCCEIMPNRQWYSPFRKNARKRTNRSC